MGIDYLTTGQAAKEIGVTRRTIDQWIAEDKIKAEFVSKRMWLIHRDEVDRVKALEPSKLGRPRKAREPP